MRRASGSVTPLRSTSSNISTLLYGTPTSLAPVYLPPRLFDKIRAYPYAFFYKLRSASRCQGHFAAFEPA